MTTEVWFRNPNLYIRQLALYGCDKIAWMRGTLVKKRIDPVLHTKSHFGTGRKWRMLVIGIAGTHEYNQDCKDETDFVACYPVWQYGEPLGVLELLLSANCADDPQARTDPTIDNFYRPVVGQEHRVVIMDAPPMTTGAGRRFFVDLGDLQREYPQAIVHLTNAWTYTAAFSQDLRSVDWDPHFYTSKNKLYLPCGKDIASHLAPNYIPWVRVLGFSATAEQFEDLEDVLRFNYESAKWAGKFYAKNENFRIRSGYRRHDPRILEETGTLLHTTVPTSKLKPQDMVTCDTCTRAAICKYYRADSVCSVPGANVTELSKFFRTRDSETIIEGLGILVAMEAERVLEARENEIETGEIDRNVTEAFDKAFKHGQDLAKLVDPGLRSPKLAVQINNGLGEGTNIKVLASQAVKALEAQGVPRSEQTPEMIMAAIGAAPPIEAKVVDEDGA